MVCILLISNRNILVYLRYKILKNNLFPLCMPCCDGFIDSVVYRGYPNVQWNEPNSINVSISSTWNDEMFHESRQSQRYIKYYTPKCHITEKHNKIYYSIIV